MLTRKPNPEVERLQEVILEHLNKMLDADNSDEYATLVDQLVKLEKLHEPNIRKPISKDVLVTAATNLAGIILILHHEQANVIASKAISFVMKSSR